MSKGLGSVQNHLAKFKTVLDLEMDQAFVYKSVAMIFWQVVRNLAIFDQNLVLLWTSSKKPATVFENKGSAKRSGPNMFLFSYLHSVAL